MSYAVIKVGGKQYRVQEGEHLLVDRLKTEPGKTFTPDVLLVDGELGPRATVTVRVVENVLGDKIRIGKYRKRTGYKRHNGFRASLSKIQVESIGASKAAPARKAEPAAESKALRPRQRRPRRRRPRQRRRRGCRRTMPTSPSCRSRRLRRAGTARCSKLHRRTSRSMQSARALSVRSSRRSRPRRRAANGS